MLWPEDLDWLNGYKNKTHIYAAYKKLTSDLETQRLKVKGWRKVSQAEKSKER